MKVYVIGAGVSKTVGYPLGVELFDEIDRFIRGSGSCFDSFDYKKDWPALRDWLESSRNPLLAEAHRTGQLEYVFTLLDLASMLRLNDLAEVYRAMKREGGNATAAEAAFTGFSQETKQYQENRRILLCALEQYFEYKHNCDAQVETPGAWKDLHDFGKKFCPGDVVITFNYDASLERVLFNQGKWSPRDGYGFDLVFQKSPCDKSTVYFPSSQVRVLHLHGATGWYTKPVFRLDYPVPDAGAVPREAFTPAPLDTPISLDPMFLRDLGIVAVDASMPDRPASEDQLLFHPSFLKNLESDRSGGPNQVFVKLWRMAAEVLRKSDEAFVIGYSLPEADTAALTLLLTNGERRKVKIVNSSVSANYRLRRLLSSDYLGSPESFQQWLRRVPDCPQ